MAPYGARKDGPGGRIDLAAAGTMRDEGWIRGPYKQTKRRAGEPARLRSTALRRDYGVTFAAGPGVIVAPMAGVQPLPSHAASKSVE